jgi:hypothetical protein
MRRKILIASGALLIMAFVSFSARPAINALINQNASTEQTPSPRIDSSSTYEIHLDVPDRAGEQYHVQTISTERKSVTVSIPKQSPRTTEEEFTIELSADVVTEAVENNWATRKRFNVLNSKITRRGNTRPLLAPGTVVVVAKSNDKTIYFVNDKVADEQTTAQLRSLIGLRNAAVGDDQMFGTTVRRAVGESWQVNATEIRILLKEMGALDDRGEISGTSTLERADRDHLFVRSSVNMRHVKLPLTGNFTPESGHVRVEYLGRVPRSAADRSRSVTGSIHVAVAGTAASASGTIKLQVVSDSYSRYEIRPRTGTARLGETGRQGDMETRNLPVPPSPRLFRPPVPKSLRLR